MYQVDVVVQIRVVTIQTRRHARKRLVGLDLNIRRSIEVVRLVRNVRARQRRQMQALAVGLEDPGVHVAATDEPRHFLRRLDERGILVRVAEPVRVVLIRPGRSLHFLIEEARRHREMSYGEIPMLSLPVMPRRSLECAKYMFRLPVIASEKIA